MVEKQKRRIDELNECIQSHVVDLSIWLNSCELRMSSEFGCGVFATRDIRPNELLFSDRPLMLGPTGNKHEPIVCVMCYERIENDINLSMCHQGCGLPLCDGTVCAEQHKNECQLLQKWKPKNPEELSFTKLKAMPVIRSLFLSEKLKRFLNLMQKNYVSFENEIFFNNEFEQLPQDDDKISALRAASAAINTNAFKVLYRSDDNHISSDVCVCGFYPIMSLINHKCSPNTRHDIDKHFVSQVLSSRPIRKDEQIFISYSQLLWATNSRRMHLIISKQFRCTCDRCIDPTEYSTNLSAIRCIDKNCTGLVLPIEPIDFNSNAKCNRCEHICENKRFLQVQQFAASMANSFLKKQFTLVDLDYFLNSRLYKLVPECNQFVVECKLKASIKCAASSYEDLHRIKCFCEDILKILDKLQVGECSLKGFLAHKLCIVRRKLKKFPEQWIDNNNHTSNSEINVFLNDDDQLWKTAKVILTNVSAASIDKLE